MSDPDYDFHVDRTAILNFAAAIGETNPIYWDAPSAAGTPLGDVIAPPTFPFTVTMKASAQAMFDPEVGLDYSRVVHGEQRFAYARPIVAGDELVVTTTIESIRTMAGEPDAKTPPPSPLAWFPLSVLFEIETGA